MLDICRDGACALGVIVGGHGGGGRLRYRRYTSGGLLGGTGESATQGGRERQIGGIKEIGERLEATSEDSRDSGEIMAFAVEGPARAKKLSPGSARQ